MGHDDDRERRLTLHSLIEEPAKNGTFGFELDTNPVRIPTLYEVILRHLRYETC